MDRTLATLLVNAAFDYVEKAEASHPWLIPFTEAARKAILANLDTILASIPTAPKQG